MLMIRMGLIAHENGAPNSAPYYSQAACRQIRVGNPIMDEKIAGFFASSFKPNMPDSGVGFLEIIGRPNEVS